jgi:hypothetical protein
VAALEAARVAALFFRVRVMDVGLYGSGRRPCRNVP